MSGSILLTVVTASLIKAYKELSVMKQPGQKESRQIGRLLATTLHEPRYWYAADALDLIDLRPEDAKEYYDVVRTFLAFLIGLEGKGENSMRSRQREYSPLVSHLSFSPVFLLFFTQAGPRSLNFPNVSCNIFRNIQIDYFNQSYQELWRKSSKQASFHLPSTAPFTA